MSVIKGILRQVEEKYCRNEITCLEWSNKLDLIAVANVFGEVIIHRLNWQHVWNLPPPEKNVTVKMLTWGPDGRVLAIAYSTDEIFVVNVEKKLVTNKMKMGSAICFLHWTEEQADIDRERQHNLVMADTEYVMELPAFMGCDGNEISNEIFIKLKTQKRLNFLIIGLDSGEVKINVFGIITCGRVNIKKILTVAPAQSSFTIAYANISASLRQLFVLLKIAASEAEDSGDELRCLVFDISQLAEYANDLFTLAHQLARILRVVDYIDYAVNSIIEAWESILVNEMMLKLNDYAASKAKPGTMTAEFVELLMCGTYFPELEAFLQKELSENHLKRISTSIEMSHSSMTKLVNQHLRPATENLLFDLTVLRGVVKSADYNISNPNKVINDSMERCLVAAGAFYVKTNEMLCVMEESQIKYRAFFRWLSNVYAVYTSDDQQNSVTNLTDTTQQELRYISEYLCSIERLCGESRQHKEELGQFLLDANLTTAKRKCSLRNSWTKFLNENPCLLEQCPAIIPPQFEDFSLVQQQNYLKTELDKCYQHFSDHVTGKCISTCTINKFPSTVSVDKVVAAVNNDHLYVSLMKMFVSKTYLEIYKVAPSTSNKCNYSIRSVSLSFEDVPKKSEYQLVDVQFYTNTVLSLILDRPEDIECSYYTQLPLEALDKFFASAPTDGAVQSMFQLVDKDLRIIENMKVSRIAVSGVRKVLVVISDDGHKIRVFEMEAEDDEDITTNTNNTSTSANNTDITDGSKFSRSLVLDDASSCVSMAESSCT